MEIVMLITVIAFGIIIWNIYDHIIRLNKTVNKQQEQIISLLRMENTQNSINNSLLSISKDIANKVISIEERVDKYTKIVE